MSDDLPISRRYLPVVDNLAYNFDLLTGGTPKWVQVPPAVADALTRDYLQDRHWNSLRAPSVTTSGYVSFAPTRAGIVDLRVGEGWAIGQ